MAAGDSVRATVPGGRRLTVTAGTLALVAVLAFAALAVAALAVSAAAPSGDESPLFDAYIWRIARFTLLQASLSTVLSIALAIPVALALARRSAFPGRIWLLRLMALPLGLPALVAVLGLIGIWGRQGTVNDLLSLSGLGRPVSIYGLSGILVAHVFFNLPLATRLLLAGLDRIPAEYWLVGANLGMKRLALFRFVEGPAIRALVPGIAGLIFMLCATSFTLVLTLGGGPAASTLEVAIYQALRFDFDPPRAIALAALQIAMTAILLAVLRLLAPPTHEGLTTGRPVRRFDGATPAARIADAATIALAALFVAAPLASVLVSGLGADLRKLAHDPLVREALATSLVIAALSAAFAVSLSAMMLGARLFLLDRRHVTAAGRIIPAGVTAATSLVLLVPPVVIGAGWFLLLRQFGNVASFAPAIVVLINTLMALPFTARILEPAMTTHRIRTERLSASLGLSGWARLRLIDGPALRRPLMMALSFAAALSLGDLGAVALFGSQETVTLPFLLYSRMGSYRSTDAAGLALLLGLVCLALTVLGTRRDNPAQERQP